MQKSIDSLAQSLQNDRYFNENGIDVNDVDRYEHIQIFLPYRRNTIENNHEKTFSITDGVIHTNASTSPRKESDPHSDGQHGLTPASSSQRTSLSDVSGRQTIER